MFQNHAGTILGDDILLQNVCSENELLTAIVTSEKEADRDKSTQDETPKMTVVRSIQHRPPKNNENGANEKYFLNFISADFQSYEDDSFF